MSKPKNILITGATGFVGANLTRRLINGKDHIHIIIRKSSDTWRIDDIKKKLNFHYADLTNLKETQKVVEKIKPQVIYHLATQTDYLDESRKILETDIFGTYNLIDVCIKIGFDVFINTGSSSEYGTKNKPMLEVDLLEPNSYYATTKAWQTIFCQHLGRDKKLPIITLRLFSVYGPYEMPWRFIPTIIKNCLIGKDLTLASSKTARDYVFVEDAVDAYLKAAQKPKLAGEIFNIGSGKQSTFKEVIETIISQTNAQVKQNWNVLPGRYFDTNVWLADISKAKKILDWQPKYSLEQGLNKTINWFRKNIN